MPIVENNELTPREYVLMENERDENRLIREHAVRLKELELALEREKGAAQIQLQQLEAKWRSWLTLPKTILLLPVYIVLALAVIMYAVTKQKPPVQLWDLIKK